MNIIKYFDDAFSAKCTITPHALKRLGERFLSSELGKLKFLIQAGLRSYPLNKWTMEESTVIIDPRFNFSILCCYYPKEDVVKIITFIRGKTPEAYEDCKKIIVSILKEKTEQEVKELNQSRKRQY